MFLHRASPSRSFSIPVSINLHGARRRQTREVFDVAVPQEAEWSRGAAGRGGHGARVQVPGSSVGEDRAVLLGFFMMAFSVLMFFVVGITTVKPFVNRTFVVSPSSVNPWPPSQNEFVCTNTSSEWENEEGCVLLHTDVPEEWVDCRGVSTVPCLRATVNLTSANQRAFLHLNEEPVLFDMECFYIPKCQMEKKSVVEEVLTVRSRLEEQRGSSSSCMADRQRHSGHAILNRKFTLRRALLALLWPCLMLGGGALLVGLVKLTQWLARLSAEVNSQSASSSTARKLYRLMTSPS